MGRRPNPERRPELLDAIVDHLVDHGIAEVSLRPLADALGTSTFTLTYHFGDKEGLINAALDHAEERQRALVREAARTADPRAPFADVVAQFWQWLCTEPGLGTMRLAFEASSLAMRRPDAFGDHAARLVTEWVDLSQTTLEAEGRDRKTARSEATLVTATLTGLLLDLLVTGDDRRVKAAAKLYLASLSDREAAALS